MEVCMKTLAFTSLFLCICTISVGQKADSLEALLQKTKIDTTKAILFSLLANELTKSNPEKALEMANYGLRLSKQIRFAKGVFENYHSLGTVFQGQSLFDSAIFYFHNANLIAEHKKDFTGQAEICSGLGHSFMRKSEMDSARHYLEKGLALARQVNNFKIEAGIYNNYGNVFLEESNYQKALDYFVQAARFSKG